MHFLTFVAESRDREMGTAEAVEEDVSLLVGNKVRFGSRGCRDPLIIESRPRYKGVGRDPITFWCARGKGTKEAVEDDVALLVGNKVIFQHCSKVSGFLGALPFLTFEVESRELGKGTTKAVEEDVALLVGNKVRFRAKHPAVALCLGTYGGPRGLGVSCERGTPGGASHFLAFEVEFRELGKGTEEAVEEGVALLVGNKVPLGSRGGRDPLIIESRPPYKGVASPLDFGVTKGRAPRRPSRRTWPFLSETR